MARACGSYPQCPEFESQHRHQKYIALIKIKGLSIAKAFNYKRTKMLEKKVLETIEKNDMLSSNDKILVGVSGGPDSVTLLKILLSFQEEYNLSIYIAHLNHMLRGKESNRDAEFVRNLAQDLNLPCEVEACDLTKIAQKRKLTLEEAAREYRYMFYFKTAEKFGVDKIALGHNADDQVETVLMRFLRGSGLEGLMGIPPVRGKIIRPLIECSREEIEDYCQEHKIVYRIDSTNKEAIYFRNKIRLELLPLLAHEYNKNIKDVILRLRIIISEISEYLQQKTETIFKKIAALEDQGKVIINLEKLNSLPLVFKRRIIRKSIKVVIGDLNSISFAHSDEILRLIENHSGEKEIYLPHNLRIKKVYNQLIIYKNKIFKLHHPAGASTLWKYNLSVPGCTEIKPLDIKVETKILDFVDVKTSLYYNREKFGSKFAEFIDYNKVKYPLKLRNRRTGDRFYPLNMKGEKKVKDFFIDNKLPKSKRDLIPIFVDRDDKIVWIVGMRLDDRVKITRDTKKVLHINLTTKRKLLNF